MSFTDSVDSNISESYLLSVKFLQYTILKVVLILLEVALVAFIALDHRWEKVLYCNHS